MRRVWCLPEWTDRPVAFVVSCEHATNHVPARYARVFQSRGAKRALASHRGIDFGALASARRLARELGCPCHAARVSRLLIDANRSLRSASLFSAFSSELSDAERSEVIAAYYTPLRREVRRQIEHQVSRGSVVVHLSVHSFTPVLKGERRRADVGLLYDPSRGPERWLCERFRRGLRQGEPALRVRRNYPYRGVSDGHTSALRREFSEQLYVGIELEFNQALLTRQPGTALRALLALVGTLAG